MYACMYAGLLQSCSKTISHEVISYSAGITACEKGQQWPSAVQLFSFLLDDGIEMDLIVCNSLISACRSQWQVALALLQEASQRQKLKETDIFSLPVNWRQPPVCTSINPHRKPLVTAYNGNWKAREMFSFCFESQAQRNGLQLDVISFNSAMSACGSASEWAWALQLLESLRKSQLQSDLISFNALISACDWTLACELLKEMEVMKLQRDVVSYNVPWHER